MTNTTSLAWMFDHDAQVATALDAAPALILTNVHDGPVTTTYVGAVPAEEDCGCELGTPVQQVFPHGTVCTGCGEQVDQ